MAINVKGKSPFFCDKTFIILLETLDMIKDAWTCFSAERWCFNRVSGGRD